MATYDGVHVIDITDKTHPVIIGSVDTPGFAEDLVIDDARGIDNAIAHVADSFAGLTIVPLPFEFTSEITSVQTGLIEANLPSPVVEGHYIIRAFHSPPDPTTPDVAASLVGAVSFTSTPDLLSSKAIIVAGGGPSAGNNIWTETMAYANQAYDNLLYQGYRHEDIYYLTDQADMLDRDGEATASNLESAITTWADSSDLLLFLVDHGTREEFLIRGGTNEESVTAEQLDSWLDSLQTKYPDGTTLVVYDACKSGSFIARQSPPNNATRITITSSTPEQVSYFLTNKHSFSAHFWSTFSGTSGDKINLADAYNRAAATMATYQTAQFDANGNGLPNEPEDTDELNSIESTIYALRRRYQNPGLDKPVIATTANNITLNGSTSTNLWAANVYDLDYDDIVRVWAEIIAPNYNPDQAGDTVTSVPEVVLSGPDGDGVYSGNYHDFSVIGTYVVTYYAEDEHGILSLPRTMLVTQTAGTTVSIPDDYEIDDRPSRANIITVNALTPENHTFHDPGDEDWSLFYGITGQVYKARAGAPSVITDPIINIYRENDTTLEQNCNAAGAGNDEECSWTCPSDGFYYLQVSNALNHYGANVYYTLHLYNPIALEFPGYVTGYVTSAGAGINGASLTASGGSGVSAPNGAFIISLPAGSVTVTATKAGFQNGSCSTTVPSGSSSPCNVTMQRNNVAPTISGTPPSTAKVGQFFSFTPIASDINGDSLVFSINNKPSWAFFDTSNGKLYGTPSTNHIGSYPITLRVTDPHNLYASLSFTITVDVNLAPVISGAPKLLIRPGTFFSFTPNTFDPEGNPFTFSILGKPSWATFSTSSGQLSGTPTSNHIGSYPITIKVTDTAGGSSSLSFGLTVGVDIPGIYILLME